MQAQHLGCVSKIVTIIYLMFILCFHAVMSSPSPSHSRRGDGEVCPRVHLLFERPKPTPHKLINEETRVLSR